MTSAEQGYGECRKAYMRARVLVTRMDWMVLLPVIVSAVVILLLYSIPPPWVKRYLGAIDDLKTLVSPASIGDAIHHAASKNDYELMGVAGEYANGAIHDAIPVFTERLANEAVGLVASMYSKGVASELGKKSGAARGYLKLPGIQKAALKTGAESLLGGGLGELLGGLDIPPEMIAQFLSGMANRHDNGGLPAPNQQSRQGSLPQLGAPV